MSLDVAVGARSGFATSIATAVPMSLFIESPVFSLRPSSSRYKPSGSRTEKFRLAGVGLAWSTKGNGIISLAATIRARRLNDTYRLSGPETRNRHDFDGIQPATAWRRALRVRRGDPDALLQRP